MRYVIAGNGIAGISAAEAIRRLDPSGHVTMIGDEDAVPYSRPMISMVLDGSIPFEKLPIRAPSIYEDLNIETRFGNRISAIDVENHEIMLLNQQRIPFDRLLIATGADARHIQAKHANLKNIHYLRTRGHVRQIVDQLPETRRPLVLGGGLVGFKAAYGLLKRGFKPTMLISSAYPLSMQVDETAGKIILDELVRNGLTVRVDISVTAFEGNGAVTGARLSDGSTLPLRPGDRRKRRHAVICVRATGKKFLPALESLWTSTWRLHYVAFMPPATWLSAWILQEKKDGSMPSGRRPSCRDAQPA